MNGLIQFESIIEQMTKAMPLPPLLGPVSRKPRKLFGPVKAFLDHLYLKTEKSIRMKLRVRSELQFIFRIWE